MARSSLDPSVALNEPEIAVLEGRRQAEWQSAQLSLVTPDVSFDFVTGSLMGPTATVRLTPIEGDLLQYLADRRGTIVSKMSF